MLSDKKSKKYVKPETSFLGIEVEHGLLIGSQTLSLGTEEEDGDTRYSSEYRSNLWK